MRLMFRLLFLQSPCPTRLLLQHGLGRIQSLIAAHRDVAALTRRCMHKISASPVWKPFLYRRAGLQQCRLPLRAVECPDRRGPARCCARTNNFGGDSSIAFQLKHCSSKIPIRELAAPLVRLFSIRGSSWLRACHQRMSRWNKY